MKLSVFAWQVDVSETVLERRMEGGAVLMRLKLVAVQVKEPDWPPGVVEVNFVCGTVLRVPSARLSELVAMLRQPC